MPERPNNNSNRTRNDRFKYACLSYTYKRHLYYIENQQYANASAMAFLIDMANALQFADILNIQLQNKVSYFAINYKGG